MEFELSNRGELKPEDVKFFYYDVAKFSELETLVELSDKKFLKVAKDYGIKLSPLNQQTFISNKYIPAENEIIFTIKKKIKRKVVTLTYQTSLLNHLRNSFSHYRISYKDNLFSMEDKIKQAYTMRGLIEIENLKSLILILREYSEQKFDNSFKIIKHL